MNSEHGTNNTNKTPLRILFVSSEVFPFAKTGGLADVSSSLPKALAKEGIDVRVIMPLYKSVIESGIKLEKIAAGIKHRFSGRIFGFDLYSHCADGVTTYFVKKDKYFSRKNLYGTSSGDYPDNALRFGYFSRAVLVATEAIDFQPHIVHCNDWHTALIPFYLRFLLNKDKFFNGIKTLFTIHNLAYQGVFGKIFMHRLGIPGSFFTADGLEFYGKLNFMKSGINYSDAINTVSSKYAEEIMTPEFGCGMDGLLAARGQDLSGIPNGVDYSQWAPESDRFIKTRYSIDDIEKKLECKKDLIDSVDLKIPQDRPVIGYVGRFADQKGVDFLADVADKIDDLNAALVILGSGDAKYDKIFRDMERNHPERVKVVQAFDEELAHKITAGSDIFLMPSRYEPCGLNQMYSIRYGTIPVVRATGGLDDVVTDFDKDNDKGNGFKFDSISAEALVQTIKRAVQYYEDRGLWKSLMRQAMTYDFSWKHSAKEYVRLYEKIMNRE